MADATLTLCVQKKGSEIKTSHDQRKNIHDDRARWSKPDRFTKYRNIIPRMARMETTRKSSGLGYFGECRSLREDISESWSLTVSQRTDT